MVVNKLKHLMERYKLSNIIKVIIILIILYLLSKLFMPLINLNNLDKLDKSLEGFQTLGYSNYGNQLSLQDPTNIPTYSGNTCIYKFDGVYRIEALNLIM